MGLDLYKKIRAFNEAQKEAEEEEQRQAQGESSN